jgi:hypothetical protein
MPHIARIQSITNQPSGGGDKKQGAPDHSNWARIPYKIFKSKTPKPYLFSATTGNSN